MYYTNPKYCCIFLSVSIQYLLVTVHCITKFCWTSENEIWLLHKYVIVALFVEWIYKHNYEYVQKFVMFLSITVQKLYVVRPSYVTTLSSTLVRNAFIPILHKKMPSDSLFLQDSHNVCEGQTLDVSHS